jgi:hypothetical protein
MQQQTAEGTRHSHHFEAYVKLHSKSDCSSFRIQGVFPNVQADPGLHFGLQWRLKISNSLERALTFPVVAALQFCYIKVIISDMDSHGL